MCRLCESAERVAEAARKLTSFEVAVDSAPSGGHMARLLSMLDHPPDGLRVDTLERWPSG